MTQSAQMITDRSFVGRRSQLAQLDSHADSARSGIPQAVLIEGEAGIGKTALVRSWLARSALQGFTVLNARCDVSETDFAFGVIEQLTGRLPISLLGQFPVIADLPTPATPPFQVGAQMLQLVSSLEVRNPVALVVDDIQWADTWSIEVLGFLLRRLEADRVIAVVIARTGTASQRAEWTAGEKLLQAIGDEKCRSRITLTGLALAETAELTRTATATDGISVSSLTKKLWERTDGHPLYLRTLISEIKRSSNGGHIGEVAVPSSLSHAVQLQLNALPEQARRLAQAAAVLDTRAPLGLVAQIAAIDDASTALEPLLTAGLMRWWPSEASTPIRLGHPLQRDAIYISLSPQQRQQLHAATAELVDQYHAWRHRVAATAGTDDKLAAELEHAATARIDEGDASRAATLLLWASDISSTRSEKERLLLTAMVYLSSITQFTRASQFLPRVLACADGPLRSLTLGAFAVMAGELSDALKHLTAAYDSLRGISEEEPFAGICAVWLSVLHFFRGDGEQTIEAARQALRIKSLQPRPYQVATTQLVWGRSSLDGPGAALLEFSKLVPLPPREQVVPEQAYSLTTRGLLTGFSGNLRDATEDLKCSLSLARDSGLPAMEEFAYPHLSVFQYLLGDWDDSLVNAENALTLVSTEAKAWARAVALANIGVQVGRGDFSQAERKMRAAAEWAKLFPAWSAQFVAIAEALLGQAKGDIAAMAAAFANNPKLSLHFKFYWKPLQVEALIGADALDDASYALGELQDAVCEMPFLHLAASRLSGQLAEARQQPAATLAAYEQGIHAPSTPNDPPLHLALLEQAYGKALGSHHNDRKQAATWLRRASTRYQALGARPFLQRCEADMAAYSIPTMPRRSTSTPGEFTERERAVAHLVGRGKTNNEIAAELFISAKTVEYHLGHIYQKLHLTGRRQLRDRMQAEQSVPS
ncbi:AAA family ATPase [Streptomyces sp. TRM72054]|uniref:helix-turn-helix transcriptional regulator n=1 Tax=Streptomyces sp. TRM72054 TaxID=2870562 RepID=UPI001C8B17A7|nr:LuxR family transcriptional regulator [Streptomyces sp. TRM72054]MBX9399328.1 AAA family ATPase [Streptomyces sp. TRM72054]